MRLIRPPHVAKVKKRRAGSECESVSEDQISLQSDIYQIPIQIKSRSVNSKNLCVLTVCFVKHHTYVLLNTAST